MHVQHVMLATDFSPAAAAAGDVARAIATQAGARLHVAHAVPPLTDVTWGEASLDREIARLGVPCERALLRGRPARELLRYAREHAVDLIVLASHGRSGFSEALMGGVAEEVVRRAPCLVLSVPAHFVPPAAASPEPDAPEPEAAAHHCIACARAAEELICAACRERIRAEALTRKLDAERPARRGT